MRLRTIVLLPLVVLALVVLAPAASAAAAGPSVARAADCGTIRLDGRAFIFFRENVGCRFAKRAVRRLHRSGGDRQPKGFRCTSGSGFTTGGGCAGRADRDRVFGWHPGD